MSGPTSVCARASADRLPPSRDVCSCKPQLAQTILSEPGMKEALGGKLLLSILAGVTISQLQDMVLPTTRVVRTMPNTPCKVRLSYIATVRAHTALTTTFSASTRARNPPRNPMRCSRARAPTQIREGMTVVSTLAPSASSELERSIILNIFSSIGRCRFLEEKHFDACTALSGSGPAFACIFLEAMADGGVMMGLPRAEALELAAQSTFLVSLS